MADDGLGWSTRASRATGGATVLAAWARTVARFALAGSAIALALLVNAFPDYPLDLPETGFFLFLVAGVAAFGAHWTVPARWVYFVGPLALLAGGPLLARAALLAAFAWAGLAPPVDLFVVRFFPLALVMLPGVLAGTAAAAATFESH